jgi:hypothetical protein
MNIDKYSDEVIQSIEGTKKNYIKLSKLVNKISKNIFGAFAEEAWTNNTDVDDPQAFIISLINEEKEPFKAMSSTGYYALYCDSSKGPCFGHTNGCLDISIASNSNANQSSSSHFGFNSFKHQGYPRGYAKAHNILAGSQYFQTIDIEVFTKKD